MRMTLPRAPRERKIYYPWVSEICGERGAESLDFLVSPLDPADFTDASVLLLLTQVLLRILRVDNPCDDSKQIRIETPK